MTGPGTLAGSKPPRIASGWLLWLTWLYVVLFGLGVLAGLASLVAGHDVLGDMIGLSVPGVDNLNLLWILRQIPYIAFAIGCVGILLRDRDFAWVAIVAAWVIVALQCIDAFLQIFHARLSIPISAFVFAAYAWKAARALRPPGRLAMPPGAKGTL